MNKGSNEIEKMPPQMELVQVPELRPKPKDQATDAADDKPAGSVGELEDEDGALE